MRGVAWLPARARIGLVVVGLAALAAVWFGVLPYDLTPRDAHAYWAVDAADPYARAELGETDAYLYSPAFAQVTEPLRLVPFEAFRTLWALIGVVSLAAIGGLPFLAAPPVIEDLVRGNIHLVMGAAIVAGFRWPSAWAFVLLTKVSAGVGLLWFAIRGEWRRLGYAIGGSLVIVMLSVALGGIDPWSEWASVLVAGAASDRSFDYIGFTPPPLAVRLPAAAVLVAWGARTDRRWTVPLSAMLALPALWPSAFAMLAAAAVLARPFGAGTDRAPASAQTPPPERHTDATRTRKRRDHWCHGRPAADARAASTRGDAWPLWQRTFR